MIAECVMRMFFLLLFWFSGGAPSLTAQSVVSLYEGSIPNGKPVADQEFKDENGIVYQVSRPTLTVFLPPKATATGTAVIICPGGGYRALVMEKEGYQVAKAFRELGVAAFVLKYRLPSDETMIDKAPGPLQDAQQAIKRVRQQAAQWNIDPKKVGIMGFSAGGHLAASAGTHFEKDLVKAGSVSLRPDFMVLVYPVISLTDSLGHRGSRDNLLGSNPSPEQVRYFSNELRVTADTPPTLLLHAGDDQKVQVANSIRFYEALQLMSVPATLHVYPDGGHGFKTGSSKEDWWPQCVRWMQQSGWMPR